MTSCISADDLVRFHAGELQGSAADLVGAHLKICPDCAQRDRQLVEEFDRLERGVRSVGAAGGADRRDADPSTRSLDRFLKKLDPTGSISSRDLIEADPDFAKLLNAGLAPMLAAVARDEAAEARAAVPPGVDDVPSSGRYELMDVLGEGGMGRVVRARDVKLDRIIAIKRLLSTAKDGPKRIAQFVAEARSIARLKHPHIVQIHDIVDDAKGHYIVMELVEGGDLHDLLCRGRLPLARALTIAIGVCDALAFAHDMGIIHRDIKPRNILLDHGTVPKLADFGLAVLQAATQDGTDPEGPESESPDPEGPDPGNTAPDVAGTPAYMAPEQFTPDHAIDARADVYALGVTLREMVTGTLVREESESRMPPLLRDVIHKATAKNPNERFDSATSFRAALRDVDTRHFKSSYAKNCAVCGASINLRDDYCAACDAPLDLLYVHCTACHERQGINETSCRSCNADLADALSHAIAILDAVRKSQQGQWRQALESLSDIAERVALPARAAALRSSLEDRARKIDHARRDAGDWLDKKRPADALHAFNDLLSLDPTDRDALTAVRELAPEVRTDDVRRLCAKTREALAKRDFATANQLIGRLRQRDADGAEVIAVARERDTAQSARCKELTRRGASLMKQRDYYEALITFSEALDLSEDAELKQHLEAAMVLAKQYERLKRVDVLLDRGDLLGAQKQLVEIEQGAGSMRSDTAIAARRERWTSMRKRQRMKGLTKKGAMLVAVAVGLAFLLVPLWTAVTSWRLAVGPDTERMIALTKGCNEALESCERSASLVEHEASVAAAESLLQLLADDPVYESLSERLDATRGRIDRHRESGQAYTALALDLDALSTVDRLERSCAFEDTWRGVEGGHRAADDRSAIVRSLEDDSERAVRVLTGRATASTAPDEMANLQASFVELAKLRQTWEGMHDSIAILERCQPGIDSTIENQRRLVAEAMPKAAATVINAQRRHFGLLESRWDFNEASIDLKRVEEFWSSHVPLPPKPRAALDAMFNRGKAYALAAHVLAQMGTDESVVLPASADDLPGVRDALDSLAAMGFASGDPLRDFLTKLVKRLRLAESQLRKNQAQGVGAGQGP